MPTARCCARTWLSLVTSGVVAAALSATNFRSSRSAIMTKASGSTGPINSPSGRNRSATLAQSRPGNPVQDCLGLTSGRLVPDQEKMSRPNGHENARGCNKVTGLRNATTESRGLNRRHVKSRDKSTRALLNCLKHLCSLSRILNYRAHDVAFSFCGEVFNERITEFLIELR
jgi:hypothetical protein